jgi:hypothetical protein
MYSVFLCCQLKQIEVQLEEEYNDKQKVLRERRELETKLLSAQDQVLSDTPLPVHLGQSLPRLVICPVVVNPPTG